MGFSIPQKQLDDEKKSTVRSKHLNFMCCYSIMSLFIALFTYIILLQQYKRGRRFYLGWKILFTLSSILSGQIKTAEYHWSNSQHI